MPIKYDHDFVRAWAKKLHDAQAPIFNEFLTLLKENQDHLSFTVIQRVRTLQQHLQEVQFMGGDVNTELSRHEKAIKSLEREFNDKAE